MNKVKTVKTWNGFSLVVLLLLLLTEGMLFLRIWNLKMLPNTYFLILAGAVLLVTLLLALLMFRRKTGAWAKRTGHGKQIIGYLLSAVIITLCCIGYMAVTEVQKTIDGITAPEKVSMVLEIYVRSEDPAEYLQDTNGYTYALPEDIPEDSLTPVIQELEELISEEIETVWHANAAAQIRALLAGEVDAVVVDSAYIPALESMEEYGDLTNRIKLLHEKVVEKEITPLPTVPMPESTRSENAFLMYISGSDSRSRVLSDGRSDVNILVAVNTDTHQILMINTPRDYYVVNPASGDGSMDKLTHCGIKGIGNSMGALSSLYGQQVDYYARINFSGFEKLVNSLGGVTIHSDVGFTAGNTYIQKGENRLNGAQALAFVRERKHLRGGDNDRGKNQMKLVAGIVNELTAGNLLANYSEILQSLEGMFTTNFPSDKIGSLVQLQLTQMPKWEIFSCASTGENGTDSCWAAGGGYAYVMYPHENVVAHASGLLDQVLTGETLTQEDMIVTQ